MDNKYYRTVFPGLRKTNKIDHPVLCLETVFQLQEENCGQPIDNSATELKRQRSEQDIEEVIESIGIYEEGAMQRGAEVHIETSCESASEEGVTLER